MNSAIHVLLAGDRDYAPHLLEHLTNKCFLGFPTGRLLDLTLDAFANAATLRALLVVGPALLQPMIPRSLKGKPTAFLEQRESFSQNVVAALQWVHEHYPGCPTIFVTNDAPLLTSTELDRFASLVRTQKADINIAVVRIAENALQTPLVRPYIRSIVTASEGLYLLANQVSLTFAAVDLAAILQKFFDFRKQSRKETFRRTLVFALKKSRNPRAILIWLRMLLAKKVWLENTTSSSVAKIAVTFPVLENALQNVLGSHLRVRINEIPGALGCFDADTQEQLNELRKVVEFNAQETRPKVATSHA